MYCTLLCGEYGLFYGGCTAERMMPMDEGTLATPRAWARARERLERTGPESIRWLTYDGGTNTGWVLWRELLAKLKMTENGPKLQNALDISEGIHPWLERGREVLVAIPSQDSSVVLLGVWDKERGQASRNLMLLYPMAESLVGLEQTAGASWFDMSFDGLYAALVISRTLTILDLDEVETETITAIQPNTLSFLPDGRLIARAVGRRTTVVTPETGGIRVEQPGTYVVPTTQPLNTQVHALMHAREVEHRFRIIRKPPAIHLPQERYIPMRKEDKISFNEWISTHDT